jgi:HEAT repeat protein
VLIGIKFFSYEAIKQNLISNFKSQQEKTNANPEPPTNPELSEASNPTQSSPTYKTTEKQPGIDSTSYEERRGKMFYQGGWYTPQELEKLKHSPSGSGDVPPEIERWVEQMRSESVDEKREAIRELGNAKMQEGGKYVMKYLDNPELQRDAIQAIWKIKYKPAGANLIRIIKNKNLPTEIREQAIATLAEFQDLGTLNTSAISSLQTILRDPKEHIDLRVNAIAAMRSLGGKDLLKDLTEAASSNEIKLQEEAIKALGEIGYSGAVEKLFSFLDPQQPFELRNAAASALGNIDSKASEIAEKLLPIVENANEDGVLQRSAKESLQKLLPKLSGPLSEKVKALK